MDADENKSKDNSNTSILRNVSMRRPRRGTLSGGDGTSNTSAKQKIATAINHIVHRRASLSTQRPKDFLAGIIIPRNEQITQARNPPPTTLRPPSTHSSHHLPISPTQSSFPLSATAEEGSLVENNIDACNGSVNKINHNNPHSRRFGPHGSSSQYPNSSSSSVSSQKKQTSSLFSRDNKNVPKDDRMDKLLKKAKNFLDHRQRPKSRIASLWSFIDVSIEFDQAQFFQQHAEEVFDVIHKSFMSQVDKIKQKSERPMSFSSKEFLNINKTLLLLRKVFLFLPERIRGGWQRRQIAEMLSHLLDHGNHPRVRIQGFQLLLLWINDQTIELTECMHLYANAISLDLFFYDQIRTGSDDYQGKENMWRSKRTMSLGQKLIKADDRGALFPNPHPPSFHDAVQLIQLDLSSLVRLAHVAAGSTPPSENYEFPVNENIERDNGIAIGMGIDAA
ncbi:15584_t:CDS:2, partial [Funneliformis geosporum]